MKELKIKRILFATDFLESSRLALDYAVAFAHHFTAKVLLIHAMELSPPAEEAFANGLRRTGLEVETLVEDGTPCQVILDAVKAHKPDLLVLGVHGIHRGMGHLLIGSNTEKILMAVSCPTLSVGAHVLAGIDLRLKLKEILYCSDLTPEAAAAGSYALLLGKAFDVPVEVCNMAATLLDEDPDEARQLAETYCQALRKIMPEAADLWCIPAFHLEHGFELDEIVARAEVESSRLIVLGVHAETQLRRHLHTSFAYQLLTKAVCPVLTIKALPNDS